MRCTCDFPGRCNGDGWLNCRGRAWGHCFCQCGCTDDCYGCEACSRSDDGHESDDEEPMTRPASGGEHLEGKETHGEA